MRVNKIIVVGAYSEGVAASNFVLSFAKGYADLGVKVTLLINTPENDFSFTYPGITLVLIKEKDNSFFTKISSYRKIIKAVNNIYTDDCIIQSYGTSLWNLFSFKKYNIFYTIGERPFKNPNDSLMTKLLDVLGLISVKKATGLLVQTNSLKNYYHEHGIKKVCVYNIIIDPKRFDGILRTTKERYITYCGLVTQYKDGLMYLLESFNSIHKKYPEYILKVVGKYISADEKRQIDDYVADNGLEDNVIFTGLLPSSEIPSILVNSDILVLPRPDNRQAKYGFPSKLGEYLLSSNPVLVTKVGEIPLFLKDNKTCKFAKPDDVESFTEGLEWIIANYEEAKIIGARGKQLALEHFTIESQCRSCFDFMCSHSIY